MQKFQVIWFTDEFSKDFEILATTETARDEATAKAMSLRRVKVLFGDLADEWYIKEVKEIQ